MTPTPSPSTTSPHTHVRLSDLSELIAGIPGLIGYPPTESLVVFTFRSTPDLWLSTTMRGDLPTPDMVPSRWTSCWRRRRRTAPSPR